jgi:hypothetical protein
MRSETIEQYLAELGTSSYPRYNTGGLGGQTFVLHHKAYSTALQVQYAPSHGTVRLDGYSIPV